MNGLFDQIVVALVVAAFSGIAGFIVKKIIFPDTDIFATKSTAGNKNEYSHLHGEWLGYHITRDRALSKDGIWIKSNIQIHISNGKVSGKVCLNHPNSKIQYLVRGEIRGNCMLLLLSGLQTKDFVTYYFPYLFSGNIIAGVWTGLDWQSNLTTAPIIFSRKKMTIEELNSELVKLRLNKVDISRADTMYGIR